MAIPPLILYIFLFGFVYLILAAQVASGFPPFYRISRLGPLALPPPEPAYVKRLALFAFGIMAALGLSVFSEQSILFAIAGLIGIAAALWTRHYLRKTVALPLAWASNPWTIRWPMLLFDGWTLGLTSAFTAMFVFSGW